MSQGAAPSEPAATSASRTTSRRDRLLTSSVCGMVEPVALHAFPSQDSESPGYPSALRAGRRGGSRGRSRRRSPHPAGATASCLTSPATPIEAAAARYAPATASVRSGSSQGENGRSGAAETGAEGAGSARGGDHDFEVGKEPRPVGLVQAVMHAGGDQAGVAGVQAEDEPAGGGDVEGRVGVGNRRRQRGASRTRERRSPAG